MRKAIIAHAGSRDHYQLALALNETGALEQLITDFYSPYFLQKLSPYFQKRYRYGLENSKVHNSYKVILMQILRLINKENDDTFFRKQDNILSEIALKKALKSDSNLFLYSYYAYHAFKNYTGDNKKILFQVHPHPLSIKRILKEEIERVPAAKFSLNNEVEMGLSEYQLQQLIAESEMADSIVVASSFTKNSLVENGIDKDIIRVIPYGVDFSKFNITKKQKKKSGTLNLIFVGNIIQRKGISYLLDAMNLLKSKKVVLTLCGRKADQALLDNYSDNDNIKVKLNLNHKELSEELNKSDIFVFPSLIEGFALVILEAMASGLPVITTKNTSGADIIEDGKQGYIIPIRSAKVLAEKIEKFIQDNNYFEMGLEAAKKAEEYTWKRFRTGISDFYNSVS